MGGCGKGNRKMSEDGPFLIFVWKCFAVFFYIFGEASGLDFFFNFR